MSPIPAHVRLDVWGIPTTAIPRALLRMATQRLRLARLDSVDFWKLLGTGSGRTFTSSDADMHHWALLTTWTNTPDARDFDHSSVARSWQRICNEHLIVEMTPIAAKGTWAGRTPFGAPVSARVDGPIAAITRARIKPTQWAGFWANVPPVSQDLSDDDGLLFSLGIGEAPVGLQGTFSIWRDNQAISDFAYRRSAHAHVINETIQRQWYAEELFARFAITRVEGAYNGRDLGAQIP